MSIDVIEFFSDWPKYHVGEICQSIVPGRNKPKSFDGDIPWITIADIDSLYIQESKQGLGLTEASIREVGARKIPTNAVIMTCVGEFGIVGIAHRDIVINQQLHAFICPYELDPYFLATVLATQKPYMERIATQTTISYMNKDACESIPIPLPPLEEQRKIAAILSTWDEAIGLVEALIGALGRRKQALMQLLLTGEVRFAGFEGAWEEVILEECVDILDNQRIPLNSTERRSVPGKIPYWGANGIIDYIDKFIFDEPLLIMAEDGGYFDQANERPICQLVDGKSWINNHAHVLRATNRAIREWVYYWFVHRDITQFINGGTRAKLNQADLRQLPISLPHLNEQIKISGMLSAIDDEIQNHQKQVECLQAQKQGLMQQLLTGAVRV